MHRPWFDPIRGPLLHVIPVSLSLRFQSATTLFIRSKRHKCQKKYL